MKNLSKYRGCLLGGAAGDALGYAVEFDSESQIRRRYGDSGITEYAARVGPALISDDTQMTLFTANGLLSAAEAGLQDPAVEATWPRYIQTAYADWLRTQEGGGPGTSSWLNNVAALNSRRAPGTTCTHYLQPGMTGSVSNVRNDSKGCGGVMRVAPIGLYFDAQDEEQRLAVDMIGAEAAAITHGHELGHIPAAVQVHMIQVLAHDPDATVAEALAGAKDAAKKLFPKARHLSHLLKLLEKAETLAGDESVTDLDAIHQLGEGWVGDEALAIAVFCALRYENDFEKAIVAAVNHKGDSDSTGAVTGNLLGARLGVTAIPEKFLSNLELRDVIVEMADDLFAGKDAASWSEKYRGHSYSGRKEPLSVEALLAEAPDGPQISQRPGGDQTSNANEYVPASRAQRVSTAMETISICEQGSYVKDGRTVKVPGGQAIRRVEIILDYPDEPQPAAPKADGSPQYILTNTDAFEAAATYLDDTTTAAVHNFAAASKPGGGFLSGSGAQEESLCRESTLYASIASPNAKMYYDRNRNWQGTFYPDDMLWSPHVVVIRDSSLNLLGEPFVTTVFTLAAPNRRHSGRAASAPESEICVHMERRLANMFAAAAERGIRSLVLGAWGCGAFCNDPETVAGITRKLLVEDGWDRNFDSIIFAIRGEADSPSVTAFRKVFRQELDGSRRG